MTLPADINSALDKAWNRDVAASSIERWLGLCESEGWGRVPDNMELLVRLFGASWYFTRFLFVNGREIAELVDREPPADLSTEKLLGQFGEALTLDSLEAQLERLRILKNTVMLQILLGNLRGQFDQAQTEEFLTHLAEATVRIIAQVFHLTPEQSDAPVTILGMGRMAGHEMTFGSDLDLIFLYAGDSDNVDAETERRIRLLLRHIAMQTPTGSLYDVDMRLRPHGNAGVLVTTFRSFLDYHSGERDVWERQMMTRCRPVCAVDDRVRALMADVERHVFAGLDGDLLRNEIAVMRARVERELGRPAGKYEVKRGHGGLMDIDFITHFFQLGHGHEREALRTASTRSVLRLVDEYGMLDSESCRQLLQAYDFLKQVEMSLRLFDMKPVSTFYYDPEANTTLARAMGFGDEGPEAFIDHYRTVTDGVRDIFNSVMQSAAE